MSNYFAHPLGSYAQHYIDDDATPCQRPHTYTDHGFSKMDFGVGGGQKVYSMTNGIIQNVGWFGGDGVSKYGCVVRTTDCGYSRMQAKLQGGTADEYPVFFTYIEMEQISPELKAGEKIKKGTYIGITNSEYAGSNLHFDIQPYERYGGGGNSDKAQHWYGAITLDEFDAYGHKGSNYSLRDHLDSHFTMDDKGNLKDYTGKYIGIPDSNGIYYPYGSSGEILKVNTQTLNGLDPDIRISRWYSYAFMMQTPIYSSGIKDTGSGSAADLKINISDEWIKLMVGVVAAECGWTGLGVSQAVLIVARNWAYGLSNSQLNDDSSAAAQAIMNWGHGLSKEGLMSKYESFKNKEIEGINTVEFVKMIMSGTHYKYAENWNGKNTDGTTGITYYNGCSAADIEDITGFPGGNSNYQNLWVCHIFFGNRFTGWSFRGDIPKDKKKPSELLGLR